MKSHRLTWSGPSPTYTAQLWRVSRIWNQVQTTGTVISRCGQCGPKATKLDYLVEGLHVEYTYATLCQQRIWEKHMLLVVIFDKHYFCSEYIFSRNFWPTATTRSWKRYRTIISLLAFLSLIEYLIHISLLLGWYWPDRLVMTPVFSVYWMPAFNISSTLSGVHLRLDSLRPSCPVLRQWIEMELHLILLSRHLQWKRLISRFRKNVSL